MGTQALTGHDLCSSTAQLTATASAHVTSGPAPLQVQFTGSASGGTPPYTWDWDFGDATKHSSTQSPAHTYEANGTYQVTLTVRDVAGTTATDTHLTIQVTSSCSISCTATAPASAGTGTTVPFTGTVTPTGCSGTVVTYWSFGDGGSSALLSPTHAYAQPGTYTWSFSAMVGAAVPCVKTGTITIATAPAFEAWVPSVAHASGVGTSQWRTNIAAVNRGASSASITLTYLPYDGAAPIQKTATLAAGATKEWADILVGLFGLSTGKGTVKVSANVPLHVTSRTYNQATTGTFGQSYPAVTTADVIPEGQLGYLPQLKNNASFRTNVGVQNIGTAAAEVEIKLFGSTGAQVGSTLTRTVSPGLYLQVDKIFEAAKAGTQEIGYATVKAKTAGARIWAYASVIDAVTSDPTTVPVLFGGGAKAAFVPSVAHAAGSGSSQWRTNIAAVNLGSSLATITLTYLPYDGSAAKVKTATLAAGGTTEWADILVGLFKLTEGKGTVEITSTQSLHVASRTYNEAASGTFGQSYPALAEGSAIAAGKIGVIPQLANNAAFRTNIGVQNLGTATATVDVKLFGITGAQVGSTVTLTPAAGRYVQKDKIFEFAKSGTQDVAYATVEVKTSGARVWAYGSVVDNSTGDPTTVAVLVQ